MAWPKVLKPKRLLIIFVLASAVLSVWAHLNESGLPDTAHKIRQPLAVVHEFMEAVNRGELIAFEITLTPDMITPERVDYSYALNSSTYSTMVYSSLKKPIPTKQLTGMEIYGISAVLNKDGVIIETRVHVRAAEQTEE